MRVCSTCNSIIYMAVKEQNNDSQNVWYSRNSHNSSQRHPHIFRLVLYNVPMTFEEDTRVLDLEEKVPKFMHWVVNYGHAYLLMLLACI